MDPRNVMHIIFLFLYFEMGLSKSHKHPTQCYEPFYKIPDCVEAGHEYLCRCPPGYGWNGKFCTESSVDSRLDFEPAMTKASYVELIGKSVPSLNQFTLALWVSFDELMKKRNATLMSYTHSRSESDDIAIKVGKTFSINLGRHRSHNWRWKTMPNGGIGTGWVHLAVTWGNSDGNWSVYLNGILQDNGTNLARGRKMKKGGELLLANSFYPQMFLNQTFLGSIAYVHVWNYVQNASEVKALYADCSFSYCGNAVQWTDFRSGIRGDVRLMWHAAIFDQNRCRINKEKDCDQFCVERNGPQCKEGYAENILWPRSPVYKSAEIKCPNDITKSAYRECEDTGTKNGQWGEVNVDNCTSEEYLYLKKEIETSMLALYFDANRIPLFLERTSNLTTISKTGANQFDLATIIEILGSLVKYQAKAVQEKNWDPDVFEDEYPIQKHTIIFAKVVASATDFILSDQFEQAWKATKPRGFEAFQLLELMEQFSGVMIDSLIRHEKRGDISLRYAKMLLFKMKFAMFFELFDLKTFNGVKFPRKSHLVHRIDFESDTTIFKNASILSVPANFFGNLSTEYMVEGDNIVGFSYIKMAEVPSLLPNHPEPYEVLYYRDKEKENLHKEDNLNSAVHMLNVFTDDGSKIDEQNFSVPVTFETFYLNDYNISNPTCVSLDMEQGPLDWEWQRSGCRLTADSVSSVECACNKFGVYAVTTDMYDEEWRPAKQPRFIPWFPMYFGIIISIALLGASLVVFFYLRCGSDTVAVHRNLAICLIFLQLMFLLSTPRIENATLCKIFSVLIHWLFVAHFGWICNEAFNLYMEVANSIHSEHMQQKPMLRYHIIGWIAPGILVGVLVLTNFEQYFEPTVCFIHAELKWFMLGPAVGIWAITVFVLVYTGKDISESSYFRDEKANKVITHHCKGCWIQITLAVVTWGFGMLSVYMLNVIPQILFAMFNILQGAFFFTFFCTLNGEVIELMQDRRMGAAQPTGLQRNTRYSIYRRYVPPRPPTRRTLSNQSGSSTQSATRRNSTDENEQDEQDYGNQGSKSPSIRELGRVAAEKLRMQKRLFGSFASLADPPTDPPTDPSEELRFIQRSSRPRTGPSKSDLEVTFQSSDKVTCV